MEKRAKNRENDERLRLKFACKETRKRNETNDDDFAQKGSIPSLYTLNDTPTTGHCPVRHVNVFNDLTKCTRRSWKCSQIEVSFTH